MRKGKLSQLPGKVSLPTALGLLCRKNSGFPKMEDTCLSRFHDCQAPAKGNLSSSLCLSISFKKEYSLLPANCVRVTNW